MKPETHPSAENNALRDETVTAASLVDEGRRCRDAGDFERAVVCLNRAIELAHDCGEAHLLLGEVLAATGCAEDALDSFYLAVHFSSALAAAHIALATALLERQSVAEAEAECRKAIAVDSTSSAAWFCLGNVLKSRGDLDSAAGAYRTAAHGGSVHLKALQQLAFVEFRRGRYEIAENEYRTLLSLAPDSADAHHNFGLLQLETGFPEEALSSFRRALALKPAVPETMTCVAHALKDLGRLDEAIDAYDAVLTVNPQFGDALGNRAQALLMRGDFAAGWKAYEQRFTATETRARSAGAAAWRGEPLAGKTIVVLPEQGIGDEIMFATCLQDLMQQAGEVVIECDPRLVGLFTRSFSKAMVLPRDSLQTKKSIKADYEISIGSLSLYFRNGLEQFPQTAGYLCADSVRVSEWRNKHSMPGDMSRIGLAWRGGTLRNRQFLRSLELNHLGAILRQRGFGFFSLQYGDRSEELQRVCAATGISISDVASQVGDDFDALASAISSLDLVITVDNTIAHLSGALGKTTWVMVPFSPEWRYGRHGDTMPWYRSVRLFRQAAPRKWDSVVEQIAHELESKR